MKRKTSPGRVIAFLILLLGACTMILPFVWMLVTSLKEANLVYTIPPQWIPDPVDWKNYMDVWRAANLITGIKNSAIISILVLTLSTLTSSMAAFAFAKLDFPAKNVIFLMLLSTMMVPGVVLLVPQFVMYSRIGWIDTLQPMIIPASLCNINNIFFMRQFMIPALPMEIVQSARVDGASEFRTFNQIVLPIMKPAMATQAIFAFVASWNNLFIPQILLTKKEVYTMPIMVSLLNGDIYKVEYGAIYLGILLTVLPIFVIYFSLSKYIIAGVALGGVKE